MQHEQHFNGKQAHRGKPYSKYLFVEVYRWIYGQKSHFTTRFSTLYPTIIPPLNENFGYSYPLICQLGLLFSISLICLFVICLLLSIIHCLLSFPIFLKSQLLYLSKEPHYGRNVLPW